MLVHIWSVKKLSAPSRRKAPARLKAFWLINKNTKAKAKKKNQKKQKRKKESKKTKKRRKEKSKQKRKEEKKIIYYKLYIII